LNHSAWRFVRLALVGAFWLGCCLQQSQTGFLDGLGSCLVWLAAATAIALSLYFRAVLIPLVWLFLVLFASLGSATEGSQPEAVVAALGNQARTVVATHIAGITKPAAALVLGITDGDTQLLPLETKNQLNLLSLTHLNAVSGTNCTIIVAMILGVLARVPLLRWQKVAIVAASLGAYLLLVGNQPSVLRAVVMAAAMLLGRAAGNRFSAVDVLGVACVSLLLLQPQLATSLGMVLSASATLGVLVLAPLVEQKLRRFLPQLLAMAISVAFAAQIFCLPFLVGIQTAYSPLGLVANLLAEPVVPVITILGVIAACLAVFNLAAAPPLLWLASLPAQFIVAIANSLGSDASRIHWPTGVIGVATAIGLAVGLGVSLARAGRSRWIGYQLTAVSLLVLLPAQYISGPSGDFPGANWFYTACDVGQGDATVLKSGSAVAVIDVGRDPGPIDACLKRLGVRRIQLLVLTHFDLDHVGGLAGLLAGRKVQGALVTDFVDTRPGAQIAENQLQRRGVPVTHAYLGLTGKLGTFGWLVLSPHKKGADSIDSNDGSISMLWVGPDATIFTMADLPASGQIRLMRERAMWWRESYRAHPVILKLSHHGSADQDPDFLAWVHPVLATISVGVDNGYGHPTQKALDWLAMDANTTLRTDRLGSLAVSATKRGLVWAGSGASNH